MSTACTILVAKGDRAPTGALGPVLPDFLTKSNALGKVGSCEYRLMVYISRNIHHKE